MELHISQNVRSSAVTTAVHDGKVEDLCHLIQIGYPVDEAEVMAWRPLHEAAAHPTDTRCLEELLKHDCTNVNWQTHMRETALLVACQRKRGKAAEEAVDLLLKAGADANIADCNKITPLMAATRAGELDVVVRLLNSGLADPNLGDRSGQNPLHVAIVWGYLEIVKTLLRAKAHISVKGECRTTPIFIAVENGRTECLRELLQVAVERDQKELVNVPNGTVTPLMIAAQKGYTEGVQLLLDHNANANLRTGSVLVYGFDTALDAAVQRKHVDCVKLLLDKMDLTPVVESYSLQVRSQLTSFARYVCPVHLAVEHESYECLKLLLLAGFNVDSVCDRQNTGHESMYILPLPVHETALSYAAYLGDTTSMKILLDHGACVNAVRNTINRDNNARVVVSCSPAFRALFNKSWEALDLLIEHGCDISFHRDNIPSNELLLLSLHNYNSTKKLLMSGSDPQLCFQKGNDSGQKLFVDCLTSIARTGKQDLVINILELLLHFTVITGHVKNTFSAVSVKCINTLKTPYNYKKWNVILQQVGRPSSLKNLSRIKIRRLLISIHGYSSFKMAVSRLHFPCTLKDYLLYSELDEV